MSWWLVSLIVVTVFSGNLVATMSTKKLIGVADSLEDLAQYSSLYQVVIRKGSSMEELFKVNN